MSNTTPLPLALHMMQHKILGAYLGSLPLILITMQGVHCIAGIPQLLCELIALSLFGQEYDLSSVTPMVEAGT